MLISELRDKVRREFLEFAWRQWAQVGLSANVTGFDRWAIDPEALILFTIEVARRDPRLFDEMLDWLVSNRRLLSMQRLRNLAGRFPVDPDLVRAVLAWAGESMPRLQHSNYERGHSGNPEAIPVFAGMSLVLLLSQTLPLPPTDTFALAFLEAANPVSRTRGNPRILLFSCDISSAPEAGRKW